MFIEENLDAITTPEPNTMLKAALDFQSNENLTLKSATNLNDGSSRFTFTKDNASQTVEFPHRIKLTIPLHSNEEARELEGRIRYRTNSDGVLVFTFSFVQNPETIQRDAMLRLAETIRAETKDIYQYEGQLKGR